MLLSDSGMCTDNFLNAKCEIVESCQSGCCFNPGDGNVLGIGSTLVLTIITEGFETGLDESTIRINDENVTGSGNFTETGPAVYRSHSVPPRYRSGAGAPRHVPNRILGSRERQWRYQ